MTNLLATNLKRPLQVQKSPSPHWVGDGFHVRTMLSYHRNGLAVSPFLLLDHAGPTEIEPSLSRRGVDEHPHRGFETVTILYQGELEHRDSGGHFGRIGAGDVQWMTAASGVVHEEKFSQAFTEKGGTAEMVQLWVNLPAKEKMSSPRYQTLLKETIPVVEVAEGSGKVRVIAGTLGEVVGPAKTSTPLNVWDIQLNAGANIDLSVPDGNNLTVVVLHGEVTLNGSQVVHGTELAIFDRSGEQFSLHANEDSMVLVLSGEPIEEPIAGYGPFVMNTEEEIKQAILDYQSGKMGHLH